MLKHFLIAVHIFISFYCYLQLNTLIDRCVVLFKERHPALPVDEPTGWKGLKLIAELFLVSAIPLLNLWLGYFCTTLDDSVVSQIINNVEVNNWQEIKEFEEAVSDSAETLDAKEQFNV